MGATGYYPRDDKMNDMYDNRHDPEYYADMQEAALDAQGLDDVWYVDRVMEIGINELKEGRDGLVSSEM